MRILHVAKKYPEALGGDSTIVYNLQKQQVICGHDVFILVSNCADIPNKPNIFKFGFEDSAKNLDKITFKRLLSLVVLFFYSFYILRKIRPTIVHSHSADMGFVVSIACRFYKLPIVDAVHGLTFSDPQHSIFKRYSEIFFLKCSNFRAIMSEDGYGKEMFSKYGLKNFVYIPNGVDLLDFSRKHTTPNKKIRILFIGRLERQKGLNYLIDAIRILIKKSTDFEVRLVGDGSELTYLKLLVDKYALGSFVKFNGKVSHKQTLDYYYTSDIVVLPSIWEGFPLTVLEAWGARLPVVVTNVGGISKICNNNENALIIPPRSPKEITNALFALINDSGLRKRLGENGRILVEEKYGWEKIAKKVEKIYEEVIK